MCIYLRPYISFGSSPAPRGGISSSSSSAGGALRSTSAIIEAGPSASPAGMPVASSGCESPALGGFVKDQCEQYVHWITSRPGTTSRSSSRLHQGNKINRLHTHTPTRNNTPDTDTHAHDKNYTPNHQTKKAWPCSMVDGCGWDRDVLVGDGPVRALRALDYVETRNDEQVEFTPKPRRRRSCYTG